MIVSSLLVKPLLLTTLGVALLAQSATLSNANGNWETASPESAGYSSLRLDVLRGWLKTEPTSSMIVIANGKIIFSYGDVAQVSKIASVRKSILSMLMGRYVLPGKIDMGKTVTQLGLEDTVAFSKLEERATLEQLLTARSGIYRIRRPTKLQVSSLLGVLYIRARSSLITIGSLMPPVRLSKS